MTEVQLRQAILARWAEGWAALHPSDVADPNYVPYTFENEVFAKDALGTLGAWARLEIKHSTREQATMGVPSKDDVRGLIFVQLFGPLGSGKTLLSTLADDVRTVLAKRRIDELNLRAGETRDPVEDDGHGWAMGLVVVRFRYQHNS